MKKTILIIAVLTTSIIVNAQQKTTEQKSKNEYSFAWGLFKSKDYPKGKSVVFEFEKPKFSTALSESPLDSAKYEQKAIFWGAIQWTEKKKNTPRINIQRNVK